MSFNKLIVVGNLGRKPELRYTPQGTAVCDFSLASNEKKKDQNGGSKDETTWFKVTFFGRQAEVAHQYLDKGHQVYVEGRLHAREWTDKDGKVRTSLEVTGSDIQFLNNLKVEETSSESVNNATVGTTATTNGKQPVSSKNKSKSNKSTEKPASDDVHY